MNDLMLCLFCQKGARVERHRAFRDSYIVQCKEGHSNGYLYADEAKSIAAWNTRSVSAALALPEIAAMREALCVLTGHAGEIMRHGQVPGPAWLREFTASYVDARAALAAIEAAK